MFSSRFRRITRAAAVTAAAGAAMFALTSPAAADPVPPGWAESCSAPQDGVSVCTVGTTVPDANGISWITGKLKAEPGVTIAAGFVSVDVCGVSCFVRGSTAGSDTAEIVTPALVWGRGASYTASASWVDGQGHRHLGVSSFPPAS